MNYEEQLYRIIKAISYPLKRGKELELALKAKLTKRELKLLKALCGNLNKEEIINQLRLNDSDYTILYDKLVKKLNKEKVKHAIYDYH